MIQTIDLDAWCDAFKGAKRITEGNTLACLWLSQDNDDTRE